MKKLGIILLVLGMLSSCKAYSSIDIVRTDEYTKYTMYNGMNDNLNVTDLEEFMTIIFSENVNIEPSKVSIIMGDGFFYVKVPNEMR